MKSLIKTTLLKTLTLALVVNLFPLTALFASNHPGGTPGGGTPSPCSTCRANTTATGSGCSSSFIYSINLGYSRMSRDQDFTYHAKRGKHAGQEGRGKYQTFDEARRSSFDSSNVNNRIVVRLNINEPTISARLYSPVALNYIREVDAEYIKTPQDDHLRQVVTESTFTDISLTEKGYRVRIWDAKELTDKQKDANGYYISLPPVTRVITEISFENPDHPALNGKLLINKTENHSGSASLVTSELVDHSDPDIEIVKLYKGLDASGPLLKETTLTFSDRGARPWDYTFERVVEEATNNNGILGPVVEVSRTLETYRDFSHSAIGGDYNGKRLMSLTTGYNGSDTSEALTTTHEYYEDPSNEYLHGRLKSTINPDGSWEYYEYTGSNSSKVIIETKYRSWKDESIADYQQGIKEETVISVNETTRTTSIGAQQISQEKFLTSKDSTTGKITYTEKSWEESGNEWAVKTTVFASDTASAEEAGRPLSITHPDGTVTLYEYDVVNGIDSSVTKYEGAGNLEAVTSGTKTITIYNRMNEVTDEESRDIESDVQLSLKTGSIFDSLGRAQKWTYNADENDYEIVQYSCCGVGFTRDRSGATKTYSRDALERVFKVVSKSSSTDTKITTNTIYNGLTTTTNRSDGTTTLLVSETTRSPGGITTITRSPDANGDGTPETTTRTTVYSTTTGPTTTTTYPDGTTSVSQSYLDGSQKSSTDQLGRTTTYDKDTHELNGGGIYTETTAPNGFQSTRNYTDQLGRTFKTLFADDAEATQTYHPFTAAAGSRGKLATSADPDGITVTYAYNAEGEQTTTTRPMPNGQQSITVTEHDVVQDSFAGTAHRTRTTVNGVLTSTSLRGIYGYRSKSINHLANDSISTSERTVPNDGAWTETSTSPDGTYSVSTTTNGLTVKQETFGSDDILIVSSEMTYDAFDRTLTQTDSRTGTTTMGAYLENGAVTSVTEPGSRTTAFTYDVMGRRLTVDAPDTLDADGNTLSNITTTTYDAAGQVTETNGDQTYRVTYTYDALGRQISMTTYPDDVGGAGTSTTTTWQYSPTRGFLLAKRDAADKGADYTHTAAGRIATRTWARGVVTTYTYDAGMLVTTDYSDATPDITLTYDNFGRPITQSNGLATSTFAYDPNTLQIDTETIAYDLNADNTIDFTRVIDRSQDTLGRNTGWQLKDNTTIENEVAYSYGSTDGRISSISNPQLSNVSFAYGYVPGSSLIGNVTGPAHTVTNTYEATRDILDLKANKKLDTSTVSAYDYSVNHIGQRTQVSNSGTAFSSVRDITWGYDSKGQVTKADSTIPGLDRAYQFDQIGNRLKSADSLTLPTSNNYTPNALNQYTAIDSLSPVHDDDGNMTSGPLPANVNANSTLIWDGENRLIEAQVNNGNTVTYVYDSQSRRIAETVGTTTTVYVYDGWNPIAEYSTTYALTKTYTWGTDLSGTMQGAGGVGGLLSVSLISNNSITNTYFPTFDGNGNVSEYLDSTGSVVAHYEYDPFGRTTVAAGPKANDFAHRFSTKPLDATTGLYYYGYRFYDPVTGRWPSRDPIQERGGINLYAFVGNDGINAWDVLGRKLEKYRGPAGRDDKPLPNVNGMVQGGNTEADWASIKVKEPVKEGNCWKVKVEGNFTITIRLNTTEGSTNFTDNFGRTPLEHEKIHEKIHSGWYNDMIDLVNPIEDWRFKDKPCAELGQKWAFAVVRYHLLLSIAENRNYDNLAYNAGLNADEAMQGAQAVLQQANQYRDQLNSGGCGTQAN